MSFLTDLMANGTPAQLATVLNTQCTTQTLANSPTRTVTTGITATGTTIADAYELTSLVNLVSTAAANTGVRLPSTTPIGQWVLVSNAGANLMYVYPHSASGTLNGGGAGGALTLGTGGAADIAIRTSSTNWELYVLAREA